MSITETHDEIVLSNDGRIFTHQEARNFQDTLNRMPTGNAHYKWIDLKTGATIFHN